MKKFILFFALFTSICMINPIAFASATNIKKEAGYISVNASTTKELEPNIAEITFAVENTSSDAQKATAENNIISNSIINALKEIASVDTDIIKTTNFSVRPVYSTTSTGKRTIKNYTATNSVAVQTKDVKKVSKFIDAAIANGANRVNGLSYSYESDKKVCNELYPAVIKDLKSQAEALALAAGTTLDGVKHMSVSCSTDSTISNGRFYAKAQDALPEAASTPIESGKVKIRVYVNADFYVK